MPLQRTCFALLAFLAFAMVIASCSSQKMIRSAQQDLLSEPVIKTAHIGISLYDAGKEKYISNYQGDKYFVPASNIKIPTCYAALKYLGDSLTALHYFIRNTDTVVISGTGSPDLLHADFIDQPVVNFLKQFKQIIFSAKLYGDFMGNGWAWNDYKEYYMAQRSELPLYGNIATIKWQN
jgi:D-alanyl-D-alanine carboxypeptidase/D-alanyl-D-alanine-endopeptidase (penicillin-binding protein 4)